jgi:hypothetical protein
VKPPLFWIRSWLIPAALVLGAAMLTVPWSYFVLKAAYDRDVTENARALARRVEQQRTITYADAGGPIDFMFPLREKVREKQMGDALRTEINSDPSVQTLVFYNILYQRNPDPDPPTPAMAEVLAVIKQPDSTVRKLSAQDVMALEKQGLVHIDEKRAQTQQFYIPWKHDGRVIGITYVELSNAALSKDFWKKESALLFQVIAWSTSGILALSAVAIFAYRAWEKAGHVQQRAELARQGLLAERGLTAAVLAHEIRNPLQALRFQLHSLRRNSRGRGFWRSGGLRRRCWRTRSAIRCRRCGFSCTRCGGTRRTRRAWGRRRRRSTRSCRGSSSS